MGRELLLDIDNVYPTLKSTDTSLEYDEVKIVVLPGPSCIKEDFLKKNDYDEVYIVPDDMTNLQVYSLSKYLLGMK